MVLEPGDGVARAQHAGDALRGDMDHGIADRIGAVGRQVANEVSKAVFGSSRGGGAGIVGGLVRGVLGGLFRGGR